MHHLLRPILAAVLASLLFTIAYSSIHLYQWDRYVAIEKVLNDKSLNQYDPQILNENELTWHGYSQGLLYTSSVIYEHLEQNRGKTGSNIDIINQAIVRIGPVYLPVPGTLINPGIKKYVLYIGGSIVTGLFVAILTMAILVLFSRQVAIQRISVRYFMTILVQAMSKAWLWALAASVPVGLFAWFIGFDRVGNLRTLPEGFFPSLTQLMAGSASWGVVYALFARAMLIPALAEFGSVDEAEKPNAGLSTKSIARRAHFALFMRTGVILAVIFAGVLFIMPIKQARRWLMLKMPERLVYEPGINPYQDLLSVNAKRIDTIYGTWWIAVQRNQLPNNDKQSGRSWAVAWIFKANNDTREIQKIPVITRQVQVMMNKGAGFALAELGNTPVGPVKLFAFPKDAYSSLTPNLINGSRLRGLNLNQMLPSDPIAQKILVDALASRMNES